MSLLMEIGNLLSHEDKRRKLSLPAPLQAISEWRGGLAVGGLSTPLTISESRLDDSSSESPLTDDDSVGYGDALSSSSTAARPLRATSPLFSPPAYTPASRALKEEVISMSESIALQLCEDGVGGTYAVRKGPKREIIGFYKPFDEEPCNFNNPKGYTTEDENAKGGIRPGTGYIREIAAYLLDHGHFAGVPETIELKLPNKLFAKRDSVNGCKVGSLQRCVSNFDGSSCKASNDMGPGRFPTHEIHRIGIFDIRILNCDRHGGNILVQEQANGTFMLRPIDHGYCLPHSLEDLDFEWLFWPQSKLPFGREEVDYVNRLDPEEDAQLLRKLGIQEECIELMRAATDVLKIGVGLGLTLRQLGEFVRRQSFYENSEFEQAILESRAPIDQGGAIEFPVLHALLQDKLAKLVSPQGK